MYTQCMMCVVLKESERSRRRGREEHVQADRRGAPGPRHTCACNYTQNERRFNCPAVVYNIIYLLAGQKCTKFLRMIVSVFPWTAVSDCRWRVSSSIIYVCCCPAVYQRKVSESCAGSSCVLDSVFWLFCYILYISQEVYVIKKSFFIKKFFVFI